jgi:carbon-monoxide dehydrogenase small subunit
VGGVASAPAALSGLDVLHGLSADDARVDQLISRAIDSLSAGDDPRADESYRRDAAAQLARRALSDAASETRSKPSTAASEPAPAPGPVAAMQERDSVGEIAVAVNARQLRPRVEPRLLLCDLLRGQLGLHATHVGCEHGVCGACNVLLDGIAVRSCLLLAVQADGHRVETLEGLRDTDDVEELVDAFVSGHALQCGFCTPGFMITLAELRRQGSPIRSEQLLGNLCRCTGYAPIKRVAEGVT